MRRIMHLLVVLIVLLLSPLTVAAHEASPDASPAAVDCVAPDLPPGTPTPLEELMPEATPAGDMATPMDHAEATPPVVANTPSEPLEGEAADDATTERVTATVENLIACLDTGNGLAFAALVTPGYLEYSFGITNPYDMVYVMEGFPSVTLITVENVLVHDDGRYSAEVTQGFADTQVDRFQAVFIEEGDQLLLDEEISLPVEGADVTIEVSMDDFAFEMSETTVPADATVAFNVANDGEYPHEFAIVRLPEGMTVEQVLEDPAAIENVQFIGGVFAEPGESAYFALQGLEPGTYTVVCFVDVPEGIPHVMRGMIAELIVE